MTNTATSQLISIRSKKIPAKEVINEPFTQPIVDSFFLVSIISSLIGMSFAGVMMWLVRNGYSSGIEYYGLLRNFHIDLLIFGFFGTAITGFVIQSAPRILGIPPMVSKPLIFYILAAPFLGMTVKYLSSMSMLGSLVMSSGYIFAALILILRQKLRAFRPHSLFVLLSLVALTSGTFSIKGFSQMLALFWLSTGAALLGTAHIFIANILGGDRIHPISLYILLTLTLITGITLLADSPTLSAFFGLALSLTYVMTSRLYQARLGRPLLRRGFQIGFAWLFIAWGVLLFGRGSLDQTLHMMTLGWGMSILYPLSIHICSYLAADARYNEKVHLRWLWLWQIVPLSRGLLFNVQSPHIAKTIGVLSLAFLIQWAYTIINLRIRRLKRLDDKRNN